MGERRIINTHDQILAAGGNGIAITYHGRDSIASGWHVWRLVNGAAVKTEPDGPWYNHGCKVFPSYSSTRSEALAAAQQWIAETYGERGPWKRNAMGDYLPERIAKAFPIRRRP